MGGGGARALGGIGGGALGLALAPATGGLSAALPLIAAGTGLGAAAATGATGGNIQESLMNGALAGGTAYLGGSALGGLGVGEGVSGLGGLDTLTGAGGASSDFVNGLGGFSNAPITSPGTSGGGGIFSGLSTGEKFGLGLGTAGLVAPLLQPPPPGPTPNVQFSSNSPGGGGSFTPTANKALELRRQLMMRR